MGADAAASLLLLLLAAAVQAFVVVPSQGVPRRQQPQHQLVRRRVTSGFPGQDGRSGAGKQQGQQQGRQQQQQQQSQEQAGAASAEGEGSYFDWKHNFKVHYVKAGVAAGKPPLLLCPGFGVGTNHFERNLGPLSESHQVYALDYLGQGRSWPEGDIEPHHGLVLSVETWAEQIIDFLENVVKEPCYLAGNSLGGFLATAVAAERPDLVKGVVLWNATPFWSFAPNRRRLSEWVKKTIVPYDGTLPAPAPLFRIGATWFDGLKNPVTVRSMLSGACPD